MEVRCRFIGLPFVSVGFDSGHARLSRSAPPCPCSFEGGGARIAKWLGCALKTHGGREFVHAAGGDPCSARKSLRLRMRQTLLDEAYANVYRRDGVIAARGHIVDPDLILGRLGDTSNRNFFKKGKNSAGRF